jgi:hypothetical protein
LAGDTDAGTRTIAMAQTRIAARVASSSSNNF